MSRFQYGAADLARLLALRAPSLAAELLPGGKREGAEWVVGSLRGEPGRSLAFRLVGERAGVWCDFASGERGDALDLVRHALFAGERVAAMRWARSWLGLGDDGADAPRPVRPAPPPPRNEGPDEAALARRRLAQRMFHEAEPVLRGTPVEAYLAARGIVLAELGRQPRALRFHPACLCTEVQARLPAMLAAITTAEGEHVATHRTWLAEVDGVWRKAPLARAKRVLGGFAGAFIPVWRGASGEPMRTAPPGEALIIAEGIETALSCAVLAPEARVIAAVSSGNLGSLVLPPNIGAVTIAADGDAPGSKARAALDAAAERFLAQGRAVRIAHWPGGDFNDALTGDGE